MKPRISLVQMGGGVLAIAGMAGALYALRTRETAPAAHPPPQAVAPPRFEDRVRELAAAQLAAKQKPKDAALALEAGGLAGDLRQYETALGWFERAEALDPTLLPALTGQGQMWMALGRPGRAVKKYQAALRLAPREPQLLLELARAHLQLRIFDQALQYAREAEKLEPDNPQVHRALGSIHSDLQEMDEARKHIERSCSLAPEDPVNWALLGDLLLRQRRYPEAEQAVRRAVALNPGHADSNILLAQVLLDGKKTPAAEKEAFALLARARVMEPANVQALLMQSQILVRTGELPLAISLLRRAREEAPRDSAVLLALGQALVRAGKSEEGVRLTTTGQKLGPRGVSFLDLEDLAARNPDPALALRLADLYLRQERHDSAIYVLERGIKRTPQNAVIRARLAAARAAADRLTARRTTLGASPEGR